ICGVCGDDPELATVCAPCVPDCGDRVCGDDGCEGSCGDCMGCGGPEPSLCQEGVCLQVCCPSCDGLACGSDGCGGSCGACEGCDGPDEALCQDGSCVEACCGTCEGKTCGDDGCGVSCGECASGDVCDSGTCVCVPDCSTNLCGADGCGGSCGTPDLCAPTVDITSPPNQTVYTKGTEVLLQGVVSDPAYAYEELKVIWEVPGIETLFEGAPGLGGWTEAMLTTGEEGPVTVMLHVENPSGLIASDLIHLHVCSDGPIETFDEPLAEDSKWKTYQYAFWHEDGWVDMTDLDTWARGAVFNVQEQVNPGNVEIRFSICTGGGGGGMMGGGMMGGMMGGGMGGGMGGWDMGADGYALSVVNVNNVEDLEAFIYGAQDGGCLAYGVSGACGDMEITSFHVEFDTYFNQGNPMQDPTASNHVAVTLNGDPGNHLLWAEYPLEDLEWHDVVVKTVGTYITVT
ncbi:MAG: hypothetical protein VX938_00545, partial [Myxococcota bacterium]|nr:hypothetical protein [Myxococcota bacterium]